MLLEGQQIEHYQILRPLGGGKMYLAKDTRLDKQVAIRVIKAETLACVQGKPVQEYRQLILPELEKIAQLDHPSIMPVYHYGVEISDETSSIAYMIMPFWKDSSLIDWLQERSEGDRLSPQSSARLITQISEALQYAHNRQIIHRHLTPSKLFLRSKPEDQDMADLWLAGFEPETTEQSIPDDPLYRAPEQWMGKVVPATDQYALAVIAYRLLTGVLPFKGNLEQVKDQHLHLQPLRPGERIAGLSPLIDTVLLKALDKQPDKRFASMTAFAADFTEAVQSKDNLCSTLVISKQEAQRGTSRMITLPGERRITLVVPAGAYDGQIIRLRGQGISTDENGAGKDLFVNITIDEMLSDVPAVVDGHVDTPTLPSEPMGKVEAGEQVEDIGDEPTMREFVSSRPVPAPETPIPPIAPVSGRITAPLPIVDPFLDEPTLRNIPLVGARNTAVPAGEEGVLVGNQEPAIRKTPSSIAQSIRNVFATELAPRIQKASQAPIVMRARRLPGIKNILMLVLACLIIIGAGSLLYNGQVNQQVRADLQASATAQIRMVSTNYASTAAAQVSATATSSYDPYPPVHGTLVFTDPLHDNKLGHHWQEIASVCGFMNAAYEISRDDQGVNMCTGGNALNNFAYQAQMTITQGDAGGLIFRYDSTNNNYYYFSINTKGSYSLSYSQNGTVIPILNPASSAAIKTGTGESNLLAVVVRGRNIDLYANNQHLAGINDATVNSGQIGMAAEDSGNSTQVSFSDVKVWNN